MGLIIGSIPVHVPKTRVPTDGSSSSVYEEFGSVDKSIYRVFSKQDDMKILVMPDRVKSEFDLFLQYAEAKTAGVLQSPGFDALDAFLGSIGVTNG